jgi:hypothetical protein
MYYSKLSIMGRRAPTKLLGGTMTFSIMTFNVTTLSIMTLSRLELIVKT